MSLDLVVRLILCISSFIMKLERWKACASSHLMASNEGAHDVTPLSSKCLYIFQETQIPAMYPISGRTEHLLEMPSGPGALRGLRSFVSDYTSFEVTTGSGGLDHTQSKFDGKS